MAADHPGLNPVPPAGPRSSLLLALALLLPLLTWVAVIGMETLADSADHRYFIQHSQRSLLLTLALVLPPLLPWFARGPGWQATLSGPLLPMLAPLPLLVLLGLTDDRALPGLLLPLGLLALAMLLLSIGLRLLTRLLHQAALLHLVQTAIGLLISGLIWSYRDNWLGWIAP